MAFQDISDLCLSEEIQVWLGKVTSLEWVFSEDGSLLLFSLRYLTRDNQVGNGMPSCVAMVVAYTINGLSLYSLARAETTS